MTDRLSSIPVGISQPRKQSSASQLKPTLNAFLPLNLASLNVVVCALGDHPPFLADFIHAAALCGYGLDAVRDGLDVAARAIQRLRNRINTRQANASTLPMVRAKSAPVISWICVAYMSRGNTAARADCRRVRRFHMWSQKPGTG